MKDHETAERAMATIKQVMPLLWPTVLGLMCARTGLIVATYGSYVRTDAGIFTDGSSLAAMVPTLILMFYLGKSRKRLSKRTIYILTNTAIAIESVGAIALGAILLSPFANQANTLVLSFIVTLASWFAIFYCLRRARGTSSSAAVTIAFGALMLSEPVIYLCSLVPHGGACIVMGTLSLLQFFFQRKARGRALPEKAHADSMPIGYFGFAERTNDGVRVLGILAVGMFILSIALGALRGFPNGEAVPFIPATRFGYMLIVIAVCLLVIWRSFCDSRSMMTTSIWILLQSSGALALISYAAFPDVPSIGAMFTTVFNGGMVGMTWYLVIAFSSYGNRDPYYYATAAWAVYIFPRALTRFVVVSVAPVLADNVQTIIVGALILLSAQVVFVQMVWLERSKPQSEEAAPGKSIRTILGLDDIEGAPEDPETIRRELMRNNTRQVQEQFMLSDRETEVLTMYALGMTQRKIAEKLCISPGTTHTHIKRIYAKTDLHSRQEILDYIERYTN